MPRPSSPARALPALGMHLGLLGLAACGRDAPTRAQPASAPAIAAPTIVPTIAPPPAAATPTTPWRECTEAFRAPMEQRVLGRRGLEPLDDRTEALRCVTLQIAGEPAFFVEVIATTGDRQLRLQGVMRVDGEGELIALREAPLSWPQLLGGQAAFETIDLDGDGTDEVLVHYDDRRQVRSSWIDVIVIRGDRLLELAGPRIAHDDGDLDEHCDGTLSRERVDGATHLVVTTTTSSGASEHCLGVGRHVFALDGERLVRPPAT